MTHSSCSRLSSSALSHFSTWSYRFPSSVEAIIWKVAAGVVTGYPLVVHVLLRFGVKFGAWKNNSRWYFICVIVAAPYLLARIYLIVEMFRSLYFLPAGAFRTRWANDAPAFG